MNRNARFTLLISLYLTSASLVFAASSPAPFLSAYDDEAAEKQLMTLSPGQVIFSPQGARDPEKPFVRMAVTKFALPNHNAPILWRTIEALRKEFGAGNFEVYVYSGKKVDTESTDLVLSSAGTYRRTLEKGARDLGTVVSFKHPDPNRAEGSVFVTLKSRDDIQNLKDLKGKKAVITGTTAFAGWLIGLGRIVSEGFDPDTFFPDPKLLGNNMPAAFGVLRAKEADVAIVRTCFLEESKEKGEDISDLKVIGAQGKTPAGCVRCSPLYPNWTLFSTPHASAEIARKAALTILKLPPDREGRRWGVASDFSTVDQLYRDLKLGQYEYLRGWTWRRLWEEWREVIVGAVVLVLMLILHGFRTSALLRRRTRELHLQEQARAKAESQKYAAQQHILRLQKAGAVGQISTIVAHELRQPLGSIVNYARGLLRLSEFQEADPFIERLNKGMREIQNEAYRADEIVTKVRNFAKGKGGRRVPVDLSDLLNKSADSVRAAAFADNVEIKVEASPIKILTDPLEAELVLINLLKNAVEAASQTSAGVVTASIERKSEQSESNADAVRPNSFCEKGVSVCVIIRDNGPRITEEKFASLNVPFNSEKAEGLGLGLSIVRGLLEDLGGLLIFKQLSPQGIEATVYFPKSTFADKTETTNINKDADNV